MSEIDPRWFLYRKLVPLNSEPTDEIARDLRNQIILEYVDLPSKVASKMIRSMPDFVQKDDIEGYAMLGLIRAVSRFNPELGVPFESYARTNMWSVIKDSIRALDWAPRSLRKQERELNRAKNELIQDLGRIPTNKDLADKLEVSEAEVANISTKAYTSSFSSLHDQSESLEIGKSVTPAVTTEDQVFAREIMKLIAKSVAALPFREALVVALHYYQGKKLAEVAECLGVSEVKVSALHSEAVIKIWQGIENLRKQ